MQLLHYDTRGYIFKHELVPPNKTYPFNLIIEYSDCANVHFLNEIICHAQETKPSLIDLHFIGKPMRLQRTCSYLALRERKVT